ncbi:MAG: hypothetical protein QGG40_20580 [Myxococcota bacterium]|jgi:Holliday junction resolvase-like predicted endonuclease|nr:hypothetical protein [Myxococcota bacterium]
MIYLLVALFGGMLALWSSRRVRVWRMQRRFARGRAGEVEAAQLLEARGYRLLDEQVTRTAGLWIDEQWQEITVRADYLAERNGKTYVVEVKTGKEAPNPAHAATRRQLLEYDHVYRTDGLVLADMERAQLHEIRFPNPGSSGGLVERARVPSLLLALGVGIALGLWFSEF